MIYLKPKNGILEPEMMSLDPQNDAFSPAKWRLYAHKMKLVDPQNNFLSIKILQPSSHKMKSLDPQNDVVWP